jgi:hypothetical protein
MQHERLRSEQRNQQHEHAARAKKTTSRDFPNISNAPQ